MKYWFKSKEYKNNLWTFKTQKLHLILTEILKMAQLLKY